MSSPLLEQLIEAFRVLPGVGSKSAQRMAYHLLERERSGGQRLAQHLPAEHVLGADVAALAAEQIVLQALQRQQFDQFGDGGGGHRPVG